MTAPIKLSEFETALANEELTATLRERGMVPSYADGEESLGEVHSLYALIEDVAATLEGCI